MAAVIMRCLQTNLSIAKLQQPTHVPPACLPACGLCPFLLPLPHTQPPVVPSQRLLPAGVEVPSSFESVGHIAHFNLRPEVMPYKRLIGQVVLDKNPTLRTVVNKVFVGVGVGGCGGGGGAASALAAVTAEEAAV